MEVTPQTIVSMLKSVDETDRVLALMAMRTFNVDRHFNNEQLDLILPALVLFCQSFRKEVYEQYTDPSGITYVRKITRFPLDHIAPHKQQREWHRWPENKKVWRSVPCKWTQDSRYRKMTKNKVVSELVRKINHELHQHLV